MSLSPLLRRGSQGNAITERKATAAALPSRSVDLGPENDAAVINSTTWRRHASLSSRGDGAARECVAALGAFVCVSTQTLLVRETPPLVSPWARFDANPAERPPSGIVRNAKP